MEREGEREREGGMGREGGREGETAGSGRDREQVQLGERGRGHARHMYKRT